MAGECIRCICAAIGNRSLFSFSEDSYRAGLSCVWEAGQQKDHRRREVDGRAG